MDIEVDPKLFVTCRLCLKDTGLYQIVPIVQHHIKYCFDIEVQPFDGLPQLICKRCKTILNEYYQTKTLFVEKQQSLKSKIGQNSDEAAKCLSQLQETVKSSQTTKNHNIHTNTHTISRETKSSICPTASAASEDEKVNKEEDNKSLSWKDHYNKYYVCRLCQKCYKKICTIKMHIRTHNLRIKYGKILKNCTIKLNKVDDCPNITGNSNAIVYSHNKILFEQGKTYYHVIYMLKKSQSVCNCDDNDSEYNSSSENNSSLKRILNDSSDDESHSTLKPRKRFRLLSKSSNDTFVIEGNRDIPSNDEDDRLELATDSNKTTNNRTETIDINDSSSEGFEQHSKVDENEAANIKDIIPMQHISSACKRRYLKKLSSEYDTLKEKTDKETEKSEPLLNHKILSIGRKVINSKKGFDCTGLLRFMEHKNLEIAWTSTDSVNDPKETNYVRIMPKLRADQSSSVKNLGWRNILELVSENPSNDQTGENISGNVTKCDTDSKSLINNSESHCQPLSDQLYEKDGTKDIDCAVLYLNSNMEANSRNKLLNASPVLNPKQLPKNIKTKQTVNVHNVNIDKNTQDNVSSDKTFFVDMDTSESGTCLPIIITSTTSLAGIDIKGKEKQKNDTSKSESALSPKQVPRIKVKPVSELMSQKALNSLNQQRYADPYTVLTANRNQTTLIFQNPVFPSQNNSQPSMSFEIVRPPILNDQNEENTSQSADTPYIILDTTDLPNKKTCSPFKYFKDLLYIHGIILLDSNESLSQDFNSIMKFKLVFKQDTRDQSFMLCISIFCNENKFCLNVKDNNQQNIDINKVSANWQWEILKACKGDIVNKMLLNAQKLGTAVYNYTKTFICLLKSIKIRSEES